jgi:hypothetical protein
LKSFPAGLPSTLCASARPCLFGLNKILPRARAVLAEIIFLVGDKAIYVIRSFQRQSWRPAYGAIFAAPVTAISEIANSLPYSTEFFCDLGFREWL